MDAVYSADYIFTGERWLKDHAVAVSGNKIQAILPIKAVPPGTAIDHYRGGTLIPALIDLQIYGAHGKLFSVYPESSSLSLLNDYCRRGGAAYCLPTVATNTYDVFFQCIDAIRAYWKSGGKGVLGIHLEGPWINAAKRGAHIASLIHAPTVAQAKELLEYGKGVIRMITLAPETCSNEVIDLILSYGIVISAGHSNATYEQAMRGYEAGITSTTHLYNAMSSLQHRAPGLVGAVMNNEQAFCSIIPDGYHVDYAAVRIAKQQLQERLFVITDAVTETDKGPYQHYLAGDKYEAAGILSGSALTMIRAIHNLVREAGIEPGEAIRMCSLYPARALQMENKLGRIEKGYEAAFCVLDTQNNVRTVIA